MKITRHFLDVGGRRVHFRRAGQGAPLLLVHQSPRSSAEYSALMAKWSERFTCIAPDTPGFGQSTSLPGEPGIDDFADAVVAFLDAAGLKQVGAYGFHSGAIILIAALKRHAGRFSAVAAGGYAVWTEPERKSFGASYLPPFQPSAYGEHLPWLWNRILEQSWFFPWYDVRHERRLPLANADPAKVHAVVSEMLDSGDAYRAGYRAALSATRAIPQPEAHSPPVLITAYDGDPLQAHLARLGEMPASWSARRVASQAEHESASFAFLLASPAPVSDPPRESADEGFVRVVTETFDGLIHWCGDRRAERVMLHAPGASCELLSPKGTLLIDLPGHGLSDDFDAGIDIETWARSVAAAVQAISSAPSRIIVGEGVSALLALAVAKELGAAGVEAEQAHVPLERDSEEWLRRQPELKPDRFGSYLTEAWSVVRASRFFWPWFRADASHAIPFAAAAVEPAQLALRHRSLLRARAGKALLRALLTADRTQLLMQAPPVIGWRVDDWAHGHAEIWLPNLENRRD